MWRAELDAGRLSLEAVGVSVIGLLLVFAAPSPTSLFATGRMVGSTGAKSAKALIWLVRGVATILLSVGAKLVGWTVSMFRWAALLNRRTIVVGPVLAAAVVWALVTQAGTALNTEWEPGPPRVFFDRDASGLEDIRSTHGTYVEIASTPKFQQADHETHRKILSDWSPVFQGMDKDSLPSAT